MQRAVYKAVPQFVTYLTVIANAQGSEFAEMHHEWCIMYCETTVKVDFAGLVNGLLLE